jgi:hypothetical protein
MLLNPKTKDLSSVNTNPMLGLLKTIFLFASGRVIFVRNDKNRQIVMEDGNTFRVFRHVKIRDRRPAEPAAAFVVRFCPRNMTVAQNIRFSVFPMLILLGFRGFREKYWCVNDATGLCQGVYAWQTIEDAENYSKSIAMRFMSNRSEPESVNFRIINQEREKYWLFQ